MRSKTTGELLDELERERDELKERLVRAERTIDILRRQVADSRKGSEESSESHDQLNPAER